MSGQNQEIKKCQHCTWLDKVIQFTDQNPKIVQATFQIRTLQVGLLTLMLQFYKKWF